MKINNSGGAGVSGLGGSQEVNANSGASQAQKSGSSRGDQVSLSNLSSALRAQPSQSPQHAGRVAQLSAAVQSGRYNVDAQALSSKIISSSTRS
jgi:flagellar biosynthesis anti-sigma factor FlgM